MRAHRPSTGLILNPLTAMRMAECILSGFEQSRSYGNTRDLIGAASLVARFTPEQLDRLERVIDTNDQVGG